MRYVCPAEEAKCGFQDLTKYIGRQGIWLIVLIFNGGINAADSKCIFHILDSV